ncbi:MAG: PD-(D/E)XK nuclease family protein [bacterium]|nr:PD-(D/E)XK nuclease family protein [bacterium]
MTELPVIDYSHIPLSDMESFDPPRAFDSSIIATVDRCPLKGLLSYWINRVTTGKRYPLTYGVAYHKFREILDSSMLQMMDNGASVEDVLEKSDQIHELALGSALEIYDENPPAGHKKEFLTQDRLVQTCEQGLNEWGAEKRKGAIIVLKTEQPFELKLQSGESYGGRMDQIVKWNRRLWLKDFKTTSMMGKTYASQFQPNAQMTGYVWGASELSGQVVEGVIIETVYNTKTTGPEHHDFLTTRDAFSIEEFKVETDYKIGEIRRMEATGIFPKKTTACNDFGGCPFRECCKQGSWAARKRWLDGSTEESHWDFAEPEKEAIKADR